MNYLDYSCQVIGICMGFDLWIWSVLRYHRKDGQNSFVASIIGQAALVMGVWNTICLMSKLGIINR